MCNYHYPDLSFLFNHFIDGLRDHEFVNNAVSH